MANQVVTAVGGLHHREALGLGRANHDDLVDPGVCLERVRRADRRVAGDEQTNSHVGLTGFQSSAGSCSSLLRRMASAAAAANMITTSGEIRFTGTSV